MVSVNYLRQVKELVDSKKTRDLRFGIITADFPSTENDKAYKKRIALTQLMVKDDFVKSKNYVFMPFRTIAQSGLSPLPSGDHRADDRGCAFFFGDNVGDADAKALAELEETLKSVFPIAPVRDTIFLNHQTALYAASHILNAAAVNPDCASHPTESGPILFTPEWDGTPSRFVNKKFIGHNPGMLSRARITILPVNVFLAASMVLELMIAKAEAAEITYIKPQYADALLGVAIHGNNRARLAKGWKNVQKKSKHYRGTKGLRTRQRGSVTDVAAVDWLKLCDYIEKRREGRDEGLETNEEVERLFKQKI